MMNNERGFKKVQYVPVLYRVKNGSLIAAVSSGIAICPSGVMVLYEVARCAS